MIRNRLRHDQERREITRRKFGFTVLGAATAGLVTSRIAHATDPDFTLAIIPDTQYLAYLCGTAFTNMMTWIVTNRAASQGGVFTANIKAVIGVGDCTHTTGSGEFATGATAYGVLDTAGIPWVNPPGNHDYVDNGGVNTDRSTLGAGYGTSGYFGAASRQTAYTGGTYGLGTWVDAYDTANYAVGYAIGSRKLLVFSVEFLPRVAVIAWAKGLHDSHLGYECIISTHSFISDAGNFMHFSGEAANLGDDNDSGNYGLNPTITTSSSAFQSGYSAWNNYLNLWSNLTLVLSGHSIYQSWHTAGSWLMQQVPLTSASSRAQTVQGIFNNWQESDAGTYSGVLPGGGGNVGPGTYCSGVPQGSSGSRIAHVMLLHFRPSAGKLDGYAVSTNTGLWEQTYANRTTAPAATPQLLFSVDYAGVPSVQAMSSTSGGITGSAGVRR
jgi:hypothetical protein